MSRAQMASGDSADIDGPYAWYRLLISLSLATIGGIGLWSAVVILPAIQDEFGVDRGEVSFAYTATMVGFATGGILMGRVAGRFGVRRPIVFGAVMICVGCLAAAMATSFWQFVLAQSVLIGLLGSSTTFGPLVGDLSLWFQRRRGIAVAIVASGNYLSGTIWPPILQYLVEEIGWRQAHVVVGVFCLVAMIPLTLLLRRPSPRQDGAEVVLATANPLAEQGRKQRLQVILVIAGLACCIAMAMPQVHIVAYCVDLGFGPARGAEMLAVMLGFGIISRLVSGLIADHIGGLKTLLLGSFLQTLALMFYLPFDGLVSLYLVSAFFGLAQGGIVPSYALIVRDYFPAREAASKVSLVLMATIFGMAIGGWMSGEIYDLTGSYEMAFLNGIAWNMLNVGIALWLLMGRRRMVAA